VWFDKRPAGCESDANQKEKRMSKIKFLKWSTGLVLVGVIAACGGGGGSGGGSGSGAGAGPTGAACVGADCVPLGTAANYA
jgi:hypothetical protein